MIRAYQTRGFGLCVLLLLCAAGCAGASRTVTIPVWQKNVEQYVTQHGNDPSALRDTTLPDTRRGYSVIGSDRPAEATDANGVLIGHRQIGGRNWFIYLVGVVRKQEVEEIRLAALNADGGKFEWKLADKNPEALRTYREYNDHLWRQRFPQRGEAPVEYLGFPRMEDQFQISVVDTLVTVVHPPSTARWELRFSPIRQHAATE